MPGLENQSRQWRVQAVVDAGRARGAIRLTLGSVDEAVGFYLDRGFTAVLLVQFLPHEVDAERRVKLALEGPLSGYEYARRSYNDIPQLFVQLPEANFRLRDRVIEEVPGISAGFVMGKDL